MAFDWVQLIKEILEHKKWTAYKLSQESGISRGYINQLARGIQYNVSLEKAMQILKYHPDTWVVGGGEIKRVSGDNND